MSALGATLRKAREDRLLANQRYLEAIGMAKQAGLNNCEIARELGVTEAAVRLYWLRHTEDRDLVTRTAS
jgi:predicted transcriptional regulator